MLIGSGMKKTSKKLSLNRETVARLDPNALKNVVGGMATLYVTCTAQTNCYQNTCQQGCTIRVISYLESGCATCGCM
jgi:hypothetical protein